MTSSKISLRYTYKNNNYFTFSTGYLQKILKQFYRNGRHAAYTNHYFPQWVIETPPGNGQFKVKQSLPFRLLRFPMRLLSALITGKPIWFLCEVIYALGFVREYIASEELS